MTSGAAPTSLPKEANMFHRRSMIFLSFALLIFASPEYSATSAQEPAQAVNLELILDSSGSMAEEISPGQTRIESAKSALNEVVDALPEREGVNVGFRVYGHEGTNTEAGRAESCQSSELKVPVEGVDKDALRTELESYEPVGWTPIALSLQRSEADFPTAKEGVINAVLLVTDGLETCGGDPCSASRNLKEGEAAITTHVIGFALAEEERANLQCIVDASGGLLLGADNTQELTDALFQVLEEIEVVVLNGTIEIEEIGGLFPHATITGEGASSDTEPQGGPVSIELTDTNVAEVPAGNYTLSWVNPSGETTEIRVEVIAGETTFVRGSLIRLPHGAGEVYSLTSLDGVLIWHDQIELGNVVWVLPGTYRLHIDEASGDAILLSMVVQTLPGSVTEVTVSTTP